MWLKLNLEGMKINIQIRNYEKSDKDKWDMQYCKVDFSFIFRNIINYKNSSEILFSCEIEELKDKLDDLLNDRITKEFELEFIEPDFMFLFSPKTSINKEDKTNYIILEPYLEWKVKLWNDGLTSNYFSTTLDVDNIKALRCYLSLIMGTVTTDDKEVIKYMNKGIIIE
ncbi:MAG: hypothetical protein PUE26_03060 [Ruminococcus sp.]|nr:hypothetical protein [Ruminococcus sp.]MDD6709117.1 hypothetical protein [Ruminococcus sp.]